jgi:hypothetical protein
MFREIVIRKSQNAIKKEKKKRVEMTVLMKQRIIKGKEI